MYNISYIMRDITFILGLYIFPILTDYIPFFSSFDELIFLTMLSIILLRILYLKYIFTSFDVLIFLYVLYSSFLVLYNHLPSSSIVQIFITSKFLIIFLYFNSMSLQYKAQLFFIITKLLIYIFIFSVILSIAQFISPTIFQGYSNDGRGIFGITPGGIFFSRTLFPEFLLMFIILLFSFKTYKNDAFALFHKLKYYIYFLVFILVFLTFARKELALLLFLTPLLFYDKISNSSKPLIYISFIIIIVMFGLAFISIFSEMNASTFTDKQVRYHIYQYAIEIFQYYYPFGSGPGTYGSIMSMQYKDVYEQFDVSRQIVGTSEERGVIFDLFLVSFLAEYGLGWLFFPLFLISMAWTKANIFLSDVINIRKLQLLFFIMLFGIAIFVPIFLNWIGFVMFAILALVSDKGKYNVHA